MKDLVPAGLDRQSARYFAQQAYSLYKYRARCTYKAGEWFCRVMPVESVVLVQKANGEVARIYIRKGW